MSDKFFPIRTDTSCQLKWNWTTLYLNWGISRTCHRTAESILTPENFENFHNTDIVIEDRKAMLAGKWPDKSCSHCREIEEHGGTSDRMKSIDIPNMHSPVLDHDPQTLTLDPTQLEVYFSNACNLGCLYCAPALSSTNNAENKKFGEFISNGLHLRYHDPQIKNLLPSFWKWFSSGFGKLKRLHVLGGEPFLQKEFETMLEYIDKHPNPDCELNIVTNLMCSEKKLDYFIEKFKNLLVGKKIKRIDITCSIDCWGKPAEFVRWGLELQHWEKNFRKLISNKWLYVSINQIITVLTIKTLPDLLNKMSEWNKIKTVRHELGTPSPGPSYLRANILGGDFWKDDFDCILQIMPETTDQEIKTKKYMQGIAQLIVASEKNDAEILKLMTFLNEKDRRRGTNWRATFPWLTKFDVV